MMQAVLQAEGLCAGYRDRPVLYDVSVCVAQGERIVLIGPNGCGKTTFLKTLVGVLQSTKGRVILGGADITHTSVDRRIRQGLGYLMQTNNAFPSLTVEENLRLSYWHNDGGYESRREWLLNIFPMLKDNLPRRAGLLSGGERQALAICMVLVRNVHLLLLDEPTAGLSPKAAAMILEALHRVQQETQVTSVMVEHNLKLVQPWVSRVLVMNLGRIVADGTPDMLFDDKRLHHYYFC
jgi:ABC-type branched-subunit amino acid transport system ATPase component